MSAVLDLQSKLIIKNVKYALEVIEHLMIGLDCTADMFWDTPTHH